MRVSQSQIRGEIRGDFYDDFHGSGKLKTLMIFPSIFSGNSGIMDTADEAFIPATDFFIFECAGIADIFGL